MATKKDARNCQSCCKVKAKQVKVTTPSIAACTKAGEKEAEWASCRSANSNEPVKELLWKTSGAAEGLAGAVFCVCSCCCSCFQQSSFQCISCSDKSKKLTTVSVAVTTPRRSWLLSVAMTTPRRSWPLCQLQWQLQEEVDYCVSVAMTTPRRSWPLCQLKW